jgi:hypothetical protein
LSGVQTGIVHRISNSESSNTARSNSSTVVSDEEDIGPAFDIDNPIEASTCVTGTRKWALRDGEGIAAWDGTVKVDGSTSWRYVSWWMKIVRPHRIRKD